MKFGVKFYADVAVDQKPSGIPDDWPFEVEELTDEATPSEGFTEFTISEFNQYKIDHQADYDAWFTSFNAITPVSMAVEFKGIEIKEHFLSVGPLNATVGQYGWKGTAQSQAPLPLSQPSNVDRFRQGVLKCRHTGITGDFGIGSLGISNLTLGGGRFDFSASICIPVEYGGLATVNNDYTIHIGLGDKINADPEQDNGVYFCYNRSAIEKWQVKVADSTSISLINTEVDVVEDTWIKLGFVVDDEATQVAFYIDDILVGVIYTDIPLGIGVMEPYFRILCTNGIETERAFLIDFYFLTQILSS